MPARDLDYVIFGGQEGEFGEVETFSQSSDTSILNTRGLHSTVLHVEIPIAAKPLPNLKQVEESIRKTRIDKGVPRGSRVSATSFGKRRSATRNESVTLEDVKQMSENLQFSPVTDEEYYRETRRLSALKSRLLRKQRMQMDSEQIGLLRAALQKELALKDRLMAVCMSAVQCLEKHCPESDDAEKVSAMFGDVFEASAVQTIESAELLESLPVSPQT